MRSGLRSENTCCKNACLQVSRALDDDPRGPPHRQQKEHFAINNVLSSGLPVLCASCDHHDLMNASVDVVPRRELSKNNSMSPLKTLAPATSATAQQFCVLWSTCPCQHLPHPLRPSSFWQPSQHPRTAFHSSVFPPLSLVTFLCPSVSRFAR